MWMIMDNNTTACGFRWSRAGASNERHYGALGADALKQGTDGVEKNGDEEKVTDLEKKLRRSARRAVALDDQRHPRFDHRYGDDTMGTGLVPAAEIAQRHPLTRAKILDSRAIVPELEPNKDVLVVENGKLARDSVSRCAT